MTYTLEQLRDILDQVNEGNPIKDYLDESELVEILDHLVFRLEGLEK